MMIFEQASPLVKIKWTKKLFSFSFEKLHKIFFCPSWLVDDDTSSAAVIRRNWPSHRIAGETRRRRRRRHRR